MSIGLPTTQFEYEGDWIKNLIRPGRDHHFMNTFDWNPA